VTAFFCQKGGPLREQIIIGGTGDVYVSVDLGAHQ
jgi:hypothetical protein